MPTPSSVVTALLVIVGAGGCAPPREPFEATPCVAITQGIVRISPTISIVLPAELGGTQCTPGVACDDVTAGECIGAIETTVGEAHDFLIQIQNRAPVRLNIDEVTLAETCPGWSIDGGILTGVEAGETEGVALHLEATEAGTCEDELRITSDAGNVPDDSPIVLVALSAVVAEP
jgi:hypothetical protein